MTQATRAAHLIALTGVWALCHSPASAVDQWDATAVAILRASGVTGGLVVHLGCGDGRLTAALRASDSYVVHGLDHDPRNVSWGRRRLARMGVYGPVSIDRLSGSSLPCADNLVNLIVVGAEAGVPESEIMRVLAPEGVLCVREGDGWARRVKPRPSEIDEWTHFLHAPDNNA